MGRQLGLLLNFAKITVGPKRVIAFEAFPAFLHSSFGMDDRAGFARERNAFEECAKDEDAGFALGFLRSVQVDEGNRVRRSRQCR